MRASAASVSRPCYEEWNGETGAPSHITDSLRCVRDLTPVDVSITGVGGVTCDVSLEGNLTVVFVSEESEYVAELENVLYAPNCGYNFFSLVQNLMVTIGIV